MPDTVLDLRFAHYLEDFANDEGFLQATHQAGLQVEKKKVLKQAREQMKGTSSTGTNRRPNEQKRRDRTKETRTTTSGGRKRTNLAKTGRSPKQTNAPGGEVITTGPLRARQ